MTPEQLEQQSRDAAVAYLQDSGVRLEFIRKEGGENWSHKPDDGVLRINNYYYRIAQPKPWYRVALMAFGTKSVDDENIESYLETNDCFIKWLTERMYY